MRKILLLLLLLTIPFLCLAETIVLKSGKTIDAPIVDRASDSIKVDIGGITITYYLDEIARINDKPVLPISKSLPSNQSLSTTSIESIVVTIEQLGYTANAALELARKLMPLSNALGFNNINNINSISNTLKSNSCIFRDFLSLTDNIEKQAPLEIYASLLERSALEIFNKVFSESKMGPEVFKCNLNSIVALIILRSKGLDVTFIDTEDTKPIINYQLPMEGMLHHLLLIKVENSYLFYDPLNCFTSEKFTFSDVYIDKGNNHFCLKNHRKDLFQAIRLYSDKAVIASLYLNLAHVIADAGYDEQAILITKDVMKMCQDNSINEIFLGDCYFNLNQLNEAIKHYEIGAYSLPECNFEGIKKHVHGMLGISYAKLHQYERSIVHLEKTLEIDPTQLDIYSVLAIEYNSIGNKQKARSVLKKGMEIAQEQKNNTVFEDLKSILESY
jgi:tetratricopeptide (TPR) repeat protein